MSYMDWSDISGKRERNANSVVVFVNRKNVGDGLTFLPIGKAYAIQSVFDEKLKRRRLPYPGEKTHHDYLVNGVSAQGELMVYSIGISVAGKMKEVFEIKEDVVPLTITVSGTGLGTEYTVRPFKGDGNFKYDPTKLHSLEQIASNLLKTPAKAEKDAPKEADDNRAF